MIRLPRDMSSDDISQWLNGGVFLIRIKPKADLIPVTWLEQEAGRVICSDFEEQIHSVPWTSCYAVWPRLGSFNAPGGWAIHMRRRAERQYRRTFNSRCVDIETPWGYKVARSLGVNTPHLASWQIALRLPWTGVYPASFDEAERWLMEGKPSVAVNRRLIVAGYPDLDKRMLYLDGMLAGTVVGGELFPTCSGSRLESLTKLLGGRYSVDEPV